MSEEVRLKPKVTLRRKGESAMFTFNEKLKVELVWSSDTDLDLCGFFKTPDGIIGGVFSNEYRSNKSDLGSLDKFPFMLHMGDRKTPRPGGEENEEIRIKSLDSISELYLCVLNYDKAVEDIPTTFSTDSGRIEITSDTEDNLEVLVDSEEEGHVYLICKITNENGEKKVHNERRVLTLGQAFRQIPGFSLITE